MCHVGHSVVREEPAGKLNDKVYYYEERRLYRYYPEDIDHCPGIECREKDQQRVDGA